MQMRECREHCGEDKLEIRQCSTSQELKCKGMQAFRMSPIAKNIDDNFFFYIKVSVLKMKQQQHDIK